jgi:hypothetical protein
MLESPESPSTTYGQQLRRLPSPSQWSPVRDFYRALLPRAPHSGLNRLTDLTVDVWRRPDRYR